MKDKLANQDTGYAHERIAEILRSAMGDPEEEGLEDETRRLMLHLSIDSPDKVDASAAVPAPAVPVRKSWLQRVLRR
ncbi:hypothetical protein [Sphingomonas gei]|uniref:hypothetical protein n=1 Tax=Sphingomonas gei TaxID=1395960 RepID=UPI0019D097D1|nr:hypothetical protein [Sphingomonas gei]